jgi:hypothetical protein
MGTNPSRWCRPTICSSAKEKVGNAKRRLETLALELLDFFFINGSSSDSELLLLLLLLESLSSLLSLSLKTMKVV